MRSFDIYVWESLSKPYWYMQYPAIGDESGVQYVRSFQSAIKNAQQLVDDREYGNHIILLTNRDNDDRQVIDINDDIEVLHAILAYG